MVSFLWLCGTLAGRRAETAAADENQVAVRPPLNPIYRLLQPSRQAASFDDGCPVILGLCRSSHWSTRTARQCLCYCMVDSGNASDDSGPKARVALEPYTFHGASLFQDKSGSLVPELAKRQLSTKPTRSCCPCLADGRCLIGSIRQSGLDLDECSAPAVLRRLCRAGVFNLSGTASRLARRSVRR